MSVWRRISRTEPRDIIDALHDFEKQGGGGLFEFAPRERRILGTAFYDALYYSIGERLAASERRP